jgi:BirA family transcriptional regulator, biotin operon repressor / biotin---[acetyl-CoA-carboxylase] ligase
MSDIYQYKSNKWNIYITRTLKSTMDEIKKELYEGKNNSLLMAYLQTNGRGRNQNKWISDLGNLFLTIKLNTYEKARVNIISYFTSIVIYETVNFFLNKTKDIIIKWPNDILIDNKKVAGILVDIISKGNKVTDIYLGVGINLKKAPKVFGCKTTCIYDEALEKVSRKGFLNKLTLNFNYWENKLKENDNSFIIKNWIKRSWPINKKISFKESKNSSITGIYKGINEDGSIKVLVNGGINNFYNIEVLE